MTCSTTGMVILFCCLFFSLHRKTYDMLPSRKKSIYQRMQVFFNSTFHVIHLHNILSFCTALHDLTLICIRDYILCYLRCTDITLMISNRQKSNRYMFYQLITLSATELHDVGEPISGGGAIGPRVMNFYFTPAIFI